MKLIGSTTYEGKTYTINDVRGFKPISEYGYPVGWYGGRVDKIAETVNKGVYLCVEGMTVIDILIEDVVDAAPNYEIMTNKELINILEERGIEVPKKATKNDLLNLIKGI